METGTKLQRLTTVLFVIEIIAILIIAIAVTIETKNLLYFFAIGAVGIFNAYYVYLMVYAIGEAAEKSAEATYILNEVREQNKRLAEALAKVNATKPTVATDTSN